MAIEQFGENLPQVVITPNRNAAKHGLSKHGTVGRTLPGEVQERAPTLGKSNTPEGGETGFWGKDGFTFGDLLDLVNPLQHIPGVSTVYRAITGDEIGIGPRLLGGAVLGGVVGFGVSAINAALEYETGKDIGDHALLAMGLASEPEVSVASSQSVDPSELLSAADPVGAMTMAMPELASAPAEAARELSEEEAAILLMAQNGVSGMALNPPTSGGADPRAIYTLGGMENATQRYQQASSMDKLQDMALSMDIEG